MPWEETENEIHWRINNPDLFRPETFRRKELGEGISLVIGKLKRPPEGKEDSMVTQSVRFDKNKDWNMSKAKAWAEEHPMERLEKENLNNADFYSMMQKVHSWVEAGHKLQEEWNKKISSKSLSLIDTSAIPPELTKTVAKLPREVKSNINDVIQFAKDYGCPKCKSKHIRLVGFMENGKKVKFGCVDCQMLWVVSDERKEKESTIYKFEKLGKEVWDKTYPNLLRFENKFFKELEAKFNKIKNAYLKTFKGQKLAKFDIGEKELALFLEAEMSDVAYDGQSSVYKSLKRPLPKALNPLAVKFIKDYSLKLAGNVTADIKENVRKQIELGLKEGEGIREIKNRITGVFDKGMEVKVPAKIVRGEVVRKEYTRLVNATTRARSIASTETIRAFNRGRYDTIKDIDEVVGWKFEASADERTCEICMGLDGKEFKKDDDTNIPPNGTHVNCRCTFSYVFKKGLSKEKLKKNKFKLHKLAKINKYRIQIPNMKNDGFEMMELQTDKKGIDFDKGWIEHGAQLKNFKEYFLHGKKVNGRYMAKDKILKKADSNIPYVLSAKNYIPVKNFSALSKAYRVKIPRELRWWEQNLTKEKTFEMINKVKKLFEKKKIDKKKVLKKQLEVKETEEIDIWKTRDLSKEIGLMIKKIEPMKIENKIKKFLGEYKSRKHIMSIASLSVQKLSGWPDGKIRFKLPLPVEGIALEEGAHRGTSGEWVYYPGKVIKESAKLLTGVQFRTDHREDSPSVVVGWVTRGWSSKSDKGKQQIRYKGLIYNYDMAKNIWQKKIRKVSVGLLTKEEVDNKKGLVATDIKEFEELSALTENNPACPAATVVAS